MKNWLKIALWSFFGLCVVVLVVMAQKAQGLKELARPVVKVHVNGENEFITSDEVYDTLFYEGLIWENQARGELDVEKIEAYLREISQVKDVKVFSLLGGNWEIDVETRKPIARIYNKFGGSFYLDSEGVTMEVSRRHAARVLVITGDISDRIESVSVDDIINNDSLKSIRKLDDIYRISSYVCNDPLFRSLIGQIHLKKNGDFVLVPLIGDQKIIFGSAYSDNEVMEKFKKLRIFYKEAMPYAGWDTYKEISLKYEDQIVCKKKETNG
jgi:cell division protein FtsQ